MHSLLCYACCRKYKKSRTATAMVWEQSTEDQKYATCSALHTPRRGDVSGYHTHTYPPRQIIVTQTYRVREAGCSAGSYGLICSLVCHLYFTTPRVLRLALAITVESSVRTPACMAARLRVPFSVPIFHARFTHIPRVHCLYPGSTAARARATGQCLYVCALLAWLRYIANVAANKLRLSFISHCLHSRSCAYMCVCPRSVILSPRFSFARASSPPVVSNKTQMSRPSASSLKSCRSKA